MTPAALMKIYITTAEPSRGECADRRDRRPDGVAIADQAGGATVVPAIALTCCSGLPSPTEDCHVVDDEAATVPIDRGLDVVQQSRQSIAGKQPMIGVGAQKVEVLGAAVLRAPLVFPTLRRRKRRRSRKQLEEVFARVVADPS